jgi:hypothetical protein
MKKLLTICLLIATTFSVKAQEMNFEETVKYINEKMICCNDFSNYDTLIAKKDGTINWCKNQKDCTVNLFDLYDKYSGGVSILEHSNGIERLSVNGIINFRISTSDFKRFAQIENEKEQIRVYNALIHLRSLCTKAKDPFDK